MKPEYLQDGRAHNTINRKLRLLTVIKGICNLVGFFLIFLQAFYFQYEQDYEQRIFFIFTLLMMNEIFIYIVQKYWNFKEIQIFNRQDRNSSNINMVNVKKFMLSNSFIMEIWNVLMLFFQPSILYTNEINQNLSVLTLIRIYLLFQYYFDYQLIRNPRLQRISKIQGIDTTTFCFKIGFSSNYFTYKIVSIVFFVLFGIGNIIKTYSSSLSDVYQAIYFIFVTMSTVGYGDIQVNGHFSRLTCIICIILGNFISSLIMVKLLSSSGQTTNQESVCYLLQRINQLKSQQQYITKAFIEHFNNQQQQTKQQRLKISFDDYVDIIKKSSSDSPRKIKIYNKKQLSQLCRNRVLFQCKSYSHFIGWISMMKRMNNKFEFMDFFNQYISPKNNYFKKGKNKRREGQRNQYLMP